MRTRPVIAGVALLGLSMSAVAADRPAEEVLAAINAVPQPKIDPQKRADPAYQATLEQERLAYRAALAPLLEELATQHPDRPEAAIAAQRWFEGQVKSETDISLVRKKAADFGTQHAGTPAGKGARQLALQLALKDSTVTYDEGKALIDALGADLGAGRVSRELALIERAGDLDPARRIALLRGVGEASPEAAPFIPGKVRQIEAIGKPFEMAFDDIASGQRVTTADFAGRVLIVDFWATWCAPCVAEMPAVKKAHEQYADKGLAVVGVSLDQPGANATVNRFLAMRQIPWPVWYQGNGVQSEFSKGWGLDEIPAYFVIDSSGNFTGTHPTFDQALEAALKRMAN